MESALAVEPAAATSPAEVKPPVAAQPPALSHDDQTVSPHMKRMLRLIKHDLEDLLTTLNSDASIDDRSK
jgi:hypothetical protein